MDHDDDARSGLDELSRLFGAETAPSPVVTPTLETPVLSPPMAAPFEDATLSAFGRPLPPLYGSPSTVASPPAALAAPTAAPYSPPPLVPAAPLSARPPLSPPAPPPPSVTIAPPEPRRETLPTAPAFGGVPIAAHRPTAPEVVAPPRPAAWHEPTAAPGRLSTEVARHSAPTLAPGPVAPPPAEVRPTAPPPYPGRGPLLPGGSPDDFVDDAQLARSTVLERIFLVLTVVLPPVGLIATAVAAVGSSRRRGWVTGVLRAGLAVGVVMSVVTAGIGYVGYKAVRQQQAHEQIVAASAAFCAAFAKDPTLGTADGGWPRPAASVPDSITAMQAYVDRWNALAKISPDGIRAGVSTVAAAGTSVIKAVQVQRTVDDAQNRPVMTSALGASGVAGWRAQYCG